MSGIIVDKEVIVAGRSFLESLAAQDFERLETLFAPQVRFRAMVPSTVREGQTAREATNWLRRWFGPADEFQLLQSTADQVFDRLYLHYRLRTHETANGWRVIEQQAYCDVQDGHIVDIWLLCSGFRPDPESQAQTPLPHFNADALYDAGVKGCADGPLEEIAALMRRMSSGQTLEVHAIAPSVAGDLPAWCRMAGHELIRHEGEHYLIRRK
jgi:TusA-related sulfurtransferase